jgi:type II secretory pathway predicted ATPase ExeA
VAHEFIRPVPMETHPLILQRYIVPTASIEELYLRIKQCLKLRVPGAIVYAMTRWGKTYAIRHVIATLRLDFPKLVTITFDCHKKKTPNESAFFSNLLRAIGHEKAETGSVHVKRARLLNKLIEMLQASRQNVLVVFGDEAQKLEIEDYEWLREVHDELEKNGFRMVTFLIGQPQLKNRKTSLKQARQTQIVGRFMIDDIEFHGIRSAEEGATCLLGYDTATYPNEAWSFTRFFFPQAWAAGMRLVTEGAPLWQQFQDAHDSLGFRTDLEVPMTYFARTVEIAITELGKDHPDFRFTPEIWKQAVLASRFSAAEEELLIITEAD